jgi:non-homologous end joining protein Ku
MEIIEQKAQHKEIAAKPPVAPTPTNVVDLVKVLQDSLNRSQVKQKRSSTRDAARRSTSTLIKQRRRAGALS